MTVLDKTEKRDGMAVYWFVDEKTDKRVYGVCFENGLFNIANQSAAESMNLANDTMADIVDAWGTSLTNGDVNSLRNVMSELRELSSAAEPVGMMNKLQALANQIHFVLGDS